MIELARRVQRPVISDLPHTRVWKKYRQPSVSFSLVWKSAGSGVWFTVTSWADALETFNCIFVESSVRIRRPIGKVFTRLFTAANKCRKTCVGLRRRLLTWVVGSSVGSVLWGASVGVVVGPQAVKTIDKASTVVSITEYFFMMFSKSLKSFF
jgi:hypothetical protein